MPQKETASSYWLCKTQEQLSKTNYSVHLTPPLTRRLSELGDCIPGFLNSNFKQALGFLLGLQALESSLPSVFLLSFSVSSLALVPLANLLYQPPRK